MLKARDNPFSIDRVLRVRYRPQGLSWETLMDRLVAGSYRGAIVGPEGVGKTTLLEDLELRLGALGFAVHALRLDGENRSLPDGFPGAPCGGWGRGDVITLDGAEQLSRVEWELFRWRTRRAGGLLITVHSAGRLPTLIECGTSAGLLAEIGAEMLGTEPVAVMGRAGELFERHGGNLREAMLEWYDVVGEEARGEDDRRSIPGVRAG